MHAVCPRVSNRIVFQAICESSNFCGCSGSVPLVVREHRLMGWQYGRLPCSAPSASQFADIHGANIVGPTIWNAMPPGLARMSTGQEAGDERRHDYSFAKYIHFWQGGFLPNVQ